MSSSLRIAASFAGSKEGAGVLWTSDDFAVEPVCGYSAGNAGQGDGAVEVFDIDVSGDARDLDA